MPDLLFELFSEEIPARMQRRAAEDLKKLVTDALVDRGFLYENATAFFTPRRLTLVINGLPQKGKDIKEEKKGPRVGAPEAALQGFLKGAGLSSLNEAKIETDPKKGDFYVAHIERKGQPTIEVLSDILPQIIRNFPWPKSMRWGKASAEAGSLRWIRPLQSILCLFGSVTEGTEVVPFEVGGLKSGHITYGHRFMAPEPFSVKRFSDYAEKLEKAFVVLDCERRKNIILHDAKDLALAQGLELVEDDGLLEEVAGLVEWPVTLIGQFSQEFLEIPPEVIRTTIRVNQKCFVLRFPNKEGEADRLANKFILVSNIISKDGGKTITSGNERVVQARLSDAKFFWDTDCRIPLEERLPKLDHIIFHEKLGTQSERVERIQNLSVLLSSYVQADENQVKRAALLAKTDLVSEMVGEFPELQGLMGRYYALQQGETPSVAKAIEDHYKPLGPTDRVPDDLVAVSVALADKIDTLVGFWLIQEKPTGSKDPYALRRAALGVIRLILSNKLRLPLMQAFQQAATQFKGLPSNEEIFSDLMNFFIDRMKVLLRDQGIRYDLIDAVFALGNQDDLLIVERRVEALSNLLKTDAGQNLLAGYRRAVNIVRIEEKKDKCSYADQPDKALIEQQGSQEEKTLIEVLDRIRQEALSSVRQEKFEEAVSAMAQLRESVDAFFEHVTVNTDDRALRQNRLRLLSAIREVMHEIANFSKIEG